MDSQSSAVCQCIFVAVILKQQLQSMYVGCYMQANKKDPGFPVRQERKRKNTVESCIEYCRSESYAYAGLLV